MVDHACHPEKNLLMAFFEKKKENFQKLKQFYCRLENTFRR